MSRSVELPPAASQRKASRPGDRNDPAYAWETRGKDRVLVLRSFALANDFLKLSRGTAQAGFGADLTPRTRWMNPPTLFNEGAGHREQRRAVARFFTLKAVATTHEPLMVALADELVGEMERDGEGDLALLSFRMAIAVVAEIVGLSGSDPRGLESRLEGFFETAPSVGVSIVTKVREGLVAQGRVLRFYLQDVRPAIVARRRESRDDVISHMLAKGMRTQDILIEALTYAAAGMVTTRQFIPMALWHLVEQPDLRARYLGAREEERHRILREIVRLDTVAGNLLRRVTEPVALDHAECVIDVRRARSSMSRCGPPTRTRTRWAPALSASTPTEPSRPRCRLRGWPSERATTRARGSTSRCTRPISSCAVSSGTRCGSSASPTSPGTTLSWPTTLRTSAFGSCPLRPRAAHRSGRATDVGSLRTWRLLDRSASGRG